MSTIRKVAAWLILSLLSVAAHAGTKYYYYTDPQGTVLAKADAQGNIVASYDYAPYGVQVLGAPPEGPTGYTGHVNDAESGLVYMQARYYDPGVGRFLSTDPIAPVPGGEFIFNRYAYGNNNPVANTDPTGKVVEYEDRAAKNLVAKAIKNDKNFAKYYNSLNESKNVWTVSYKYHWDGTGSQATPDSPRDAVSKSNGGTGKGTGGTIRISKNEESTKVADKPGGQTRSEVASPEEKALHEFDHAVRQDQGSAYGMGPEGASNAFGDIHKEEHQARSAEDRWRVAHDLTGQRNNVNGN